MSVAKIDELIRRAQRYQIPEEQRAPRLLVPANEIIANMREPEMVVHGMLERDTIASLVGKWGGGKTAVALDVSLRVATGLPVHGRAVRRGLVVYVAGEGQGGFGRRISAWAAHNQIPMQDVPFYMTRSAVPMPDSNGPAALQTEIAEVAESLNLEPQIIVLDTLARNLNGDENSSADMGAFVQAIDTYLRRPFGACVLVLHHPGHADRSRGRGASVFPAAVDVEYLLERDADTLRLRVGKPPKDFEPPDSMCWNLTPIPLLINDKAASGITVTEIASDDRPAPTLTGLGASQRRMLMLLQEEIERRREALERGGHDGNGARVTVEEWRDLGIEAGAIKEHRNAFYGLRDALMKRQAISIERGFVVPTATE